MILTTMDRQTNQIKLNTYVKVFSAWKLKENAKVLSGTELNGGGQKRGG